jgi:lipopolysaccharide export system permease protein
MSRLALHVSARVALSTGFVTAVMFALVGLVQFIVETSRGAIDADAFIEGAIKAAVFSFYYALEILPVYLLMGAILALMEMQRRYELVAMKSAGVSIWRLAGLPVALAALAGVVISLGLDPFVLGAARQFEVPLAADTNRPGSSGWLSLQAEDGRYFIHADRINSEVPEMINVSVYAFDSDGLPIEQILADDARLEGGRWVLGPGTRHRIAEAPEPFDSLTLSAAASASEVRLALGSASTMSYYELSELVNVANLEPTIRTVAEMRLARLQALPLVLVGSLLIAFAFTARYRRGGAPGATILYGVLLGFVVFVITRLAEQAGSAGILEPVVAAWGPAIVATVIGVTALLYVEDG